MKKIFIIAVLIIILLTSGCTPDKTTSVEEDKLQKVTVALDWFPNTNHTGLYVAKNKGFFEEEGLDVKIVQLSEGGTAQIVAAGKAEFGISYQEEVTNARAEDIPVKAVAAIIQHNTSGFASPVEKNIKTPKDFEGKTYGGWSSPAEEAMLKALMEKHGSDFDKLKMVNIGAADFFTSIERDIDFAWIYYGWTGVEAELRGIELNFIALKDEHPALDFYTPVIIVGEQLESDNPELIKKFLKATSKGYNYAIKKPEQAAEILLQEVPDLDRDLVLASQKYLSKQYKADASVWGIMEPSRWKKYADWMFQQGLIPKNIDPEKAFTNKYLFNDKHLFKKE